MFHLAIKVEFGPHWVDWLTLGATLLSVAATTWLGFLAYKNGKKATAIANQSAKTAERAVETQKETSTTQINADYNARLDTAIAQLFRKVREYYGPLDSWIDEAEKTEVFHRMDPYTGELLYPKDPPIQGVIAELEIVHLFAGQNDGRVVMAADSAMRAIAGTYASKRWESMLELISVIRMWRTSHISRSDAVSALDSLNREAMGHQVSS